MKMVEEIEVFDIDKKNWKSINYIDKTVLRMLYPGAVQLSGKEMLVFGGFDPVEKPSSEEHIIDDKGMPMRLSKRAKLLDVTSGTLKEVASMPRHTYFFSGSSHFTHIGKLYCFGYLAEKEIKTMKATQNPTIDKKVVLMYKP